MREATLIPGRKFRVDFFIKPNVTVDCEGAIFVKGGHSTGVGITRDITKANLLLLSGYRPFRVTAKHIQSGEAIKWIKAALSNEYVPQCNSDAPEIDNCVVCNNYRDWPPNKAMKEFWLRRFKIINQIEK